MASDDDVIRLADELTSCTQTARIPLPSFELPEFDQGWMTLKSIMITFYHDFNKRKTNLNPIVVGLFDSTILGGGQKSPPYLTLYW